MCFNIKDAKEVVKAWESLKGGRHYHPTTIQNWLINDMKPVIEKLRKKIKTHQQRIKPQRQVVRARNRSKY